MDLLQRALGSGTGEAATGLFTAAKPAITASVSAVLCSDVLAFAIAVCSYYVCRAMLLPILVPENHPPATTEGLDALSQEDEEEEEEKDEPANTDHKTEDTSNLAEARQSQGEAVKATISTRICNEEGAIAVEAGDCQHAHREEQKDAFGCTQLHLAAHAGDATEVDKLLDKGFNVHARENFGDTPLHLAVRSGCTETTQALLARGGSPHAHNMFKSTPLSIAASFKDKTMYNLLQVRDSQV
eukprot:TRINITY_DN200_c0_g1_i1.p1 TRINITY_DN200_c0_g1~~TRINITY_DN200_c0_g1_i1.p1  ORF type:complete len:273 (-),score=59.28 TRINITY_DN200_c0_g1_i1:279-1004(-)